jgi:hypothetical protein
MDIKNLEKIQMKEIKTLEKLGTEALVTKKILN